MKKFIAGLALIITIGLAAKFTYHSLYEVKYGLDIAVTNRVYFMDLSNGASVSQNSSGSNLVIHIEVSKLNYPSGALIYIMKP